MNNWFKFTINSFVLLGLCFFFQPQVQAKPNKINHEIMQLEDEFKTLSSAFYQDSSSYSADSLQEITSIEILLKDVNKLKNANQPIAAIQLIYYNIDTLKDNADTKDIFEFMQLLLDQNEWNLANTLFRAIKNDGDKSLLATVQFIFAKYHAQRNEWKQVNKLLKGITTELSEENAAYANLLNGTALQRLKKHRKALVYYNKIKPTSQYFRYAQLNSAIANIRQGWWTDAQIKIKTLLKNSNKENQDELTNRLYLVLGYALLQREYYRDARDAFRNIGLNSQYTNRALLGIGLTATSQGDFIGGLNALTILKDKKTYDLSVDESYLLVPYVYEKLQQEMTVTTSYSEAMNYYQQRIELLDDITVQHLNFSKTKYIKKTMSLVIEKNSFDYGSKYPKSFIENYQHIIDFKAYTSNSKIKRKTQKLISKYDSTYQKIIADLADKRKESLKSYLNQSRYGLARLYDNTTETGK